MKKVNLIVGLILLVLASSCTRVKDAELAPSTKAKNFKEIKVGDNFKWSTTNTVNLNIQGLETITPISNILIVTSEDKKETYFASNTLMSNSFKAEFTLPNHVKKISVSFGTITKIIDVNSTNLSFDYLSPIED